MPAKRDNAEEIKQIMLETARVQVAALNAGIVFWSGWVEGASKFVQTVNEELMQVGAADADTTIGKITDSSREFLRQMTELPNTAVSRFNSDLSKQNRKTRPKRAARAKN